MSISLYEIWNLEYNDIIEDFKNYPEILSMPHKTIEDWRKLYIAISKIYDDNNYLLPDDQIIISKPNFDNIMTKYNYREGMEILNGFETHKRTFLIKIKNYLLEGVNDKLVEEYLLNQEHQHSRRWIIDALLTINPNDVNEYKNLGYIDSLPILRYIGTENQFRQKFKDWYDNYLINMDYKKMFIDHLNEIVKYIPNYSKALEVYNVLKNINIELLNNPNDNITRFIDNQIYKLVERTNSLTKKSLSNN